MLAAPPFRFWAFEESHEHDLDEPITHYVFPRHGLELRCDSYGNVSTIFLYSDELNGFDEKLLGIPFSLTRKEVLERFGAPTKSGGRVRDQILGDYGAWDRFARSGRAIHIEYRADADSIKKITLIRADAVP